MSTETLPKRLAEVALLSEQSPGPEEALILPFSEADREELPEFLARQRRPVVLRGFLDGTHLQDLTFEDIRAKAGHHILTAADKPEIASKVYNDSMDTEPMRLGDYLAHEILADGPPAPGLYERYRNLRIPKEFRRDLGLVRPRFLPREELRRPCIWIGKGGTSTCLHTDPNDNFVVMAIGTKRFHLFPPRDLQWLYLGQVSRSALLTSPVDPRRPELDRYPDFRNTHGSLLELQAGDLFFLPLGWAHFVESPTASFTYNYWLKPDATPFFKRTSDRHWRASDVMAD